MNGLRGYGSFVSTVICVWNMFSDNANYYYGNSDAVYILIKWPMDENGKEGNHAIIISPWILMVLQYQFCCTSSMNEKA